MSEPIYCKDCGYYQTTEVKSVKQFCIGPPGESPKWVRPCDTCKRAIKKKEKENGQS